MSFRNRFVSHFFWHGFTKPNKFLIEKKMGESNNFEQFDIILGSCIEEQSFLFSSMPGCIIKKKK